MLDGGFAVRFVTDVRTIEKEHIDRAFKPIVAYADEILIDHSLALAAMGYPREMEDEFMRMETESTKMESIELDDEYVMEAGFLKMESESSYSLVLDWVSRQYTSL